jgi:hypothetical protein
MVIYQITKSWHQRDSRDGRFDWDPQLRRSPWLPPSQDRNGEWNVKILPRGDDDFLFLGVKLWNAFWFNWVMVVAQTCNKRSWGWAKGFQPKSIESAQRQGYYWHFLNLWFFNSDKICVMTNLRVNSICSGKFFNWNFRVINF